MEEELLIAFDSTQQALRAEMLLEYAEIEIDIFPTPKEITAGCAMSIQFLTECTGRGAGHCRRAKYRDPRNLCQSCSG